MKIIQNLFNKLRSFFSSYDEELTLKDLVLFICEGSSLPSPLSADEELVLLERLESGDETAKTELIERNLRLVVFISKKFITSGHSMDDLISIGSIGLIKGVNSFKLDKNIKLATYASRCIENEILMFLRKTTKVKMEVSLDEPIKKDSEGTDLVLADLISAGEGDESFKDIEANIEKVILRDAIGKLSKREAEIMILRFGLGGDEEKTQKEVADYLNISQSYISRLEKKIISKLKKELTLKIVK